MSDKLLTLTEVQARIARIDPKVVTEQNYPEIWRELEALRTAEAALKSLKWALDYGTFEVAEDNAMHAIQFDGARRLVGE